MLCCCCVRSAAYKEPVKFPTKAESRQTVLSSSVWFLSVLHPKCSDHRGGRGVDGVGFRVCTHRRKWPRGMMEKPRRHTPDLIHRAAYSSLKEVVLPGVRRVSAVEGRALPVDFRAASCLLDLQHS